MKILLYTVISILSPILLLGQNLEIEGDSYLTGKLGIGTEIPESLLHLYSTGTLGAGSRLIFGDDLLNGRTNAYVAEWGWQTQMDSDILELSGFFGIKFTTGSNSNNTPMEINSAGDVIVTGKIRGIEDPVLAQDAATKNYVDQMSEMMLDAGLNGIVKDIDGNVYKTIKIGSQVWMAENLKTTHYNDGTSLPLVTDNATWPTLTTPGYCWYDNDPTTYATQFGALYNYFCVADTSSKNVCPVSWHVPTDSEITDLLDYLEDNAYGHSYGVSDIAKSIASTFGWNSDGTTGNIGNDQGTNNSSKFSVLPSGMRSNNGLFYNTLGSTFNIWSSTNSTSGSAWGYETYSTFSTISRSNRNKFVGSSIRCLKN